MGDGIDDEATIARETGEWLDAVGGWTSDDYEAHANQLEDDDATERHETV